MKGDFSMIQWLVRRNEHMLLWMVVGVHGRREVEEGEKKDAKGRQVISRILFCVFIPWCAALRKVSGTL